MKHSYYVDTESGVILQFTKVTGSLVIMWHLYGVVETPTYWMSCESFDAIVKAGELKKLVNFK
jgi:hypothetical protein